MLNFNRSTASVTRAAAVNVNVRTAHAVVALVASSVVVVINVVNLNRSLALVARTVAISVNVLDGNLGLVAVTLTVAVSVYMLAYASLANIAESVCILVGVLRALAAYKITDNGNILEDITGSKAENKRENQSENRKDFSNFHHLSPSIKLCNVSPRMREILLH